MRLVAAGIAIVAVLWLVGRGDAADTTVSATGVNTFNPSNVTINVGDTVTWTNMAGHNATANDSSWSVNGDGSRQFNSAGTFGYFCTIHGAGMSGSVTVQGAPDPTATNTPVPTNTPAPVPTPAPSSFRSRLAVMAKNGGLASGDVDIFPGNFVPRTKTVPVGTTVRWVDQGTIHTVTSPTGLFDSGALSPGMEFTYTFSAAGTYPYYCTFHGTPEGSGHAGTIVVTG